MVKGKLDGGQFQDIAECIKDDFKHVWSTFKYRWESFFTAAYHINQVYTQTLCAPGMLMLNVK